MDVWCIGAAQRIARRRTSSPLASPRTLSAKEERMYYRQRATRILEEKSDTVKICGEDAHVRRILLPRAVSGLAPLLPTLAGPPTPVDS